MVGIAASTAGQDSLDAMVRSLDAEEWYRVELLSAGETGRASDVGLALVHHGEKDPGGHATWEGATVGVLHGAISNRADLGLSHAEVFRRVLDRPTVTLPRLSGPFLLAAADRDGTLVVASDKLGTRECYLAETPDGVVAASDLSAVAERLDDPEIDARTAADLLSFGFALGDETLVSGVEAFSPASFLRVSEGDSAPSVRRYREPSFSRLPEEGYVERTLSAYRRASSARSSDRSGRSPTTRTRPTPRIWPRPGGSPRRWGWTTTWWSRRPTTSPSRTPRRSGPATGWCPTRICSRRRSSSGTSTRKLT
nr:hypothetical protein [Halorussus sp. DT72]